jgi:zinc transporter ZupT
MNIVIAVTILVGGAAVAVPLAMAYFEWLHTWQRNVLLMLGKEAGTAMMIRAVMLIDKKSPPPMPFLYRYLRSLEAGGVLETEESEPLPERGGRPLIYYRIKRPSDYRIKLEMLQ